MGFHVGNGMTDVLPVAVGQRDGRHPAEQLKAAVGKHLVPHHVPLEGAVERELKPSLGELGSPGHGANARAVPFWRSREEYGPRWQVPGGIKMDVCRTF